MTSKLCAQTSKYPLLAGDGIQSERTNSKFGTSGSWRNRC